MQKSPKLKWLGITLAGFILSISFFTLFSSDSNTDWLEYNGDGSRSHYSSLNQINQSNVKQLKVAWIYGSGGADTVHNRTQMQCNPIVVNGILYGVSADTQVFAVDAATGKEIWKTNLTDNGGTTSRGVSYWESGKDKRIFFGASQWLYAINADNGELDTSFGKNGRIDLKPGLERPGADNYISSNTPNTIYKNLIITGVRVNESESALLGDIRAFDTRTGELVWTFHTIPKEGQPGYETWYPAHPRDRHGGANAWMGMAIDRKRGIVYIPTGSAAPDFYGVDRKGDNLYANCLLALEAETGRLLWHYQLVRHDIWDRDPPCPPNLLTITRNGKQVDVVAQVTKQGHVFVFDRVSGEPVFPIEEKSFPQTGVPGEQPSPTQPIPVLPEPFTRQSFTEKDFNPWVTGKDSLVAMLRNSNTGSPYIPLSERPTIFFPGTDGGAQWGGAATSPDGMLYVPAKEIPVHMTLVQRKQDQAKAGSDKHPLYIRYCSSCHGEDRKGSHDGTYPGLLSIKNTMSKDNLHKLLMTGRGMMPSFSHLTPAERTSIVEYLMEISSGTVAKASTNTPPYQHLGYNRWYDSAGYPVSTPPWGTLTAMNLNTGKIDWQVPLGEYRELTQKGIPPTGTDNYGGPLVTKGDLVFIAASRDEKIRAFDRKSGEILWEADLPAAGYASPSTYSINGKQYIVIACGGGKLKTRSGDKYVAFTLAR